MGGSIHPRPRPRPRVAQREPPSGRERRPRPATFAAAAASTGSVRSDRQKEHEASLSLLIRLEESRFCERRPMQGAESGVNWPALFADPPVLCADARVLSLS